MTTTAQKQGYVFSITHYADDPDRVAVPLVLANNALAMGQDVLLWLTLDGVKLAKHNGGEGLQPKSFPAIQELLDNFTSSGGKIGVCPPCAKTHDVSEDNMIENAAFMGAAAMLDESQRRESAWF
jgi:predicted peroxiredoxin